MTFLNRSNVARIAHREATTGPCDCGCRRARSRGAIFSLLLLPLASSGCRAQPVAPTAPVPDPFSSAQTVPVRSFGAVGGGRADDTAALARALTASSHTCLDGEGLTYRVTGTLRVSEDLCLRNATLAQSLVPFDTRRYIRNPCATVVDPGVIIDCGDPPVRKEDLKSLSDSLGVRTLFIRPKEGARPLRLLLDHVKVDTGRYPQAGSRTDSAGIWIEGVDGGTLRNVEVTGAGKGHPLIVLRSRNMYVDSLWVHDVVWAPYAGEPPLSKVKVAAIGWNRYPIHEFRRAGESGAKAAKFYGVRVQEQLTCALFMEVHNVVIRNARVSKCVARFSEGDLPWQADGLDIARSSSDVVVDSPIIENVWEGMDISGNEAGIDRLQILNPRVSNCFSYCLKLGKQLRRPTVTGARITNAGIAGIVFYGRVRTATLKRAYISGVGAISLDGRLFQPWPKQPTSGVRIDQGKSGDGNGKVSTPDGVVIEDVVVSGHGSPHYAFGVLNKGGAGVRVRSLNAAGFSREAVGEAPEGRYRPSSADKAADSEHRDETG